MNHTPQSTWVFLFLAAFQLTLAFVPPAHAAEASGEALAQVRVELAGMDGTSSNAQAERRALMRLTQTLKGHSEIKAAKIDWSTGSVTITYLASESALRVADILLANGYHIDSYEGIAIVENSIDTQPTTESAL